MIEVVKVSEKGKSQLAKLKKHTGVDNWNVLCRWALCASLAEDSVPPFEEIKLDSNIEMTWKTFAGKHDSLYLSLMKQRLNNDSIPQEEIALWFSIHLHRGVSYLVKSWVSPSDFPS